MGRPTCKGESKSNLELTECKDWIHNYNRSGRVWKKMSHKAARKFGQNKVESALDSMAFA